MNRRRWLPHLTVAAIIEKEGRFLMVKENPHGTGQVLNQPAGHVEQHETLLDAVVREVCEETQYHFTPCEVSGIYRWHDTVTAISYLRVVFCGELGQFDPHFPRDPDIIDVHWYRPESLRSAANTLRSPMVLQAIDDYLAGQRLPLTLIRELGSG